MNTIDEQIGKYVPRHRQRPATPVVSIAAVRRPDRDDVVQKVKLVPTGSEVMTASAIRREREALANGRPPKLREAKIANAITMDPGTQVLLAPYGRPLVRQVLAATISASGISHGLIVGPSRSQYIIVWRMAGMYLAKKLVDVSYPEIGRVFGRDHSTVMHACGVSESRPNIMACAERIKAVLK